MHCAVRHCSSVPPAALLHAADAGRERERERERERSEGSRTF